MMWKRTGSFKVGTRGLVKPPLRKKPASCSGGFRTFRGGLRQAATAAVSDAAALVCHIPDGPALQSMKTLPLLLLVISACVEPTIPTPQVVQPTGGGDVVRRSYGDGHVMFELDPSIDASQLDLAKTRLMTVRRGANDALEIVEAAGEIFVDDQTLAIELADTPRPGDVYRAVTEAGGRVLDLGDVV